jgi:hypothetical protein
MKIIIGLVFSAFLISISISTRALADDCILDQIDDGINFLRQVKNQLDYIPSSGDIDGVIKEFNNLSEARMLCLNNIRTHDQNIMETGFNFYQNLEKQPTLTNLARKQLDLLLDEVGTAKMGIYKRYDSSILLISPQSDYLLYLEDLKNYLQIQEELLKQISNDDQRAGFILRINKTLRETKTDEWEKYLKRFASIYNNTTYRRNVVLPHIDLTKYFNFAPSAKDCINYQDIYNDHFNKWPVFNYLKETATLLTGKDNKENPVIIACVKQDECTSGLFKSCNLQSAQYNSKKNELTLFTRYVHNSWGGSWWLFNDLQGVLSKL